MYVYNNNKDKKAINLRRSEVGSWKGLEGGKKQGKYYNYILIR